MKDMRLTDSKANKIRNELELAGYIATSKVMYVRYTKKHGDSVFIHHSLDIIRCRQNTEASKIIESILGKANGKAAESQDNCNYLSWFMNGYKGKSTTRVE